MPKISFKKQLEQLAKQDPVIGEVIRAAKLKALLPREDYFGSLVRAIISQQLSTKAAESIRLRFLAEFGIHAERGNNWDKSGKFPNPKVVIKKPDARLRAVGLSGAKVEYIKNLAWAVVSGDVDLKNIDNYSDEEVIEMLTRVKGIGRWTAEMFLIFSLGRPNVFSHGDLGLKNAIKKLYNIDPKLHKKKYLKLVESWSPHQSLASRHLWASLNIG